MAIRIDRKIPYEGGYILLVGNGAYCMVDSSTRVKTRPLFRVAYGMALPVLSIGLTERESLEIDELPRGIVFLRYKAQGFPLAKFRGSC